MMRRKGIVVLVLLLTGCISVYQPDGSKKLMPIVQFESAHLPGWDYCPEVGWRRANQFGESQCDCFGPNGEVLPACASCYDEAKRPIPNCLPGCYGRCEAKVEGKKTAVVSKSGGGR